MQWLEAARNLMWWFMWSLPILYTYAIFSSLLCHRHCSWTISWEDKREGEWRHMVRVESFVEELHICVKLFAFSSASAAASISSFEKDWCHLSYHCSEANLQLKVRCWRQWIIQRASPGPAEQVWLEVVIRKSSLARKTEMCSLVEVLPGVQHPMFTYQKSYQLINGVTDFSHCCKVSSTKLFPGAPAQKTPPLSFQADTFAD